MVFALFDEKLSAVERKAMAKKLIETPPPLVRTTGKPSFRGPVNLLSNDPNTPLSSCVGPKSWIQFERLQSDTAWLRLVVF